MFAVFSNDDVETSCLVDHRCVRKRSPPLKAEVETVGAKYARILQFKRLGIHFKQASSGPKPKLVIKPKTRANPKQNSTHKAKFKSHKTQDKKLGELHK